MTDDLETAFQQLQTYQAQIPALFASLCNADARHLPDYAHATADVERDLTFPCPPCEFEDSLF